MKLHVSEDLVPVNELRTNLARWIDRLQETDRPLVVTQRGKAAAVMMSPEAVDAFDEERQVVRNVLQGLRDVEAGRLVDDREVWERIDRLMARAEVPDEDPLD